MRFLISFFLSLLIYFLIVFLFFKYVFLEHKKIQKEVLIHTAVIQNSFKYTPERKNILKKAALLKKIPKKEPVKKIKKGSKTNITKGGEVDFKDIFKNVKTNIKTAPLKLKKSEEMSRFRGLKRAEKLLENIKNVNVDISYENRSSNNLKEEEINKIISKIAKVWDEVSDIPGEYAKIHVINNDRNIEVVILDSNIDENKQKLLISLIKTLNFDKNFNLNILFQTKVNK